MDFDPVTARGHVGALDRTRQDEIDPGRLGDIAARVTGHSKRLLLLGDVSVALPRCHRMFGKSGYL